MNRYLKDYLAGVQSPEASGFEHLNTLLVRDKLFEQEKSLTPTEQTTLLRADYLLIKQIDLFLAELQPITSLAYERQSRKPSSEQWWWYLDIITHLPFLQPWLSQAEHVSLMSKQPA
jgi:hypothetical protein